MAVRPSLLIVAASIVPRVALASDPPPQAVLVLAAPGMNVETDERLGRIEAALRASLGAAPFRLIEGAPARSRVRALEAEGLDRYARLRPAESLLSLRAAVEEADRTGGEGLGRDDLATLHVHCAMASLLEGDETSGHASLDRAVAAAPDLTLDPGQYPPWIRNAWDEAARRAAARPRGTLALRADPPGARLALDGRPVGASPARVDEIEYGVHLVRAEAEGRLPAVARVELREPLHSVSLALGPDVGRSIAPFAEPIAAGDPTALARAREATSAALALVLVVTDRGEELDLGATLRDLRAPGAVAHARTHVRSDLVDLDRRAEGLGAALAILPEAAPAPPPAVSPHASPARPPREPLWARWWTWAIAGAVVVGTGALVAYAVTAPHGVRPTVTLPQ